VVAVSAFALTVGMVATALWQASPARADDPQFDASQSRLAVSSVWMDFPCGGGYRDAFMAEVTARDTAGNLLRDLDPSLMVVSPSSAEVTVGTVFTLGDGVYRVPLKLGSGIYSISATYAGSAKIADDSGNTDLRISSDMWTPEPDPISSFTHFTVDKTSVVVGGVSTMTLTYTPTPTCAPGRVNLTVNIESGAGRIVDTGAVTVSADGKTATVLISGGDSVPVQITSDVAGVVSVGIPGMMQPNINGTPFDIRFTAPESMLVLSPSQVVSGDRATAKVFVTPAPMNPIRDVNVQFTVTNKSTGDIVATPSCNTGASGECSVDLPTDRAGTFEVAATVTDPIGGTSTPVQNSPQTLTVDPQPPVPGPTFDPSQSLLSVSFLRIDSQCGYGGFNDNFIATVTAKDSQGNPLPGLDPSLMVFTPSSTSVTVGTVTALGMGDYSAPLTLSGSGPYTISAAYDGGPKIADASGNTDLEVARDTLYADPDWIAASTSVAVDKTSVVIGGHSTMTVSYARADASCAPTGATLQASITSGTGRFVDTGAYPVSADGQTATLKLTDGASIPVQITSDVAGVVSVIVPGGFIPYINGTPVNVTFSAPAPTQFDASKSVLSVSNDSTLNACGTATGGVTTVTLTARNGQGDLMTDLDPSLVSFKGSPDVSFSSPVINNGDGTYSVEVTGAGLSGTASVSYDGSGDVPTDVGSTTINVSFLPPIAETDYVSPATTVTPGPAWAMVGGRSVVTIEYAPADLACAQASAPASASYYFQITGGAGKFVDTGDYTVSPDGSAARVVVPAGETVSVPVTSTTAGEVTVNVSAVGSMMPSLPPGPFNIMFMQSILILSPAQVISGDPATATAIIVDTYMNPVREIVVNFTVTNKSSGAVVATSSCTADASGLCSVDLPTDTVGTFEVAAAVVDTVVGTSMPLENSPQTLTVVAQSPTPGFDPSQSLLSVDTPVTQDICGGLHIGARTVTLKAVDYAGNLMTNLDPLLVKFTGSAPDDTFGPVVNNGDGTYSAEVISAGGPDDVGSVSYDGSADVSAGDGGTTVPLVQSILSPPEHDWVTPATTITPPPSSVPVGSTSSMTITYSPDNVALACAGSVADYSLHVVGAGRFVDTGDYDISSDGQYAVVTVPAGQPVTVVTTSDTPGVATVNVTAWLGYATGSTLSFDITFTAPAPTQEPDASRSVLSVSSTWINFACGYGGEFSNFVATVTAKDSQGDLMTDLDPSLIVMTASSSDVAFGKVVNNGDGTYSAPFTLAGEGPYTISATFSGGPKIADSTGNTDLSVAKARLYADPDWVAFSTSITADKTTVPVGDISTMTVSYEPASTCAPSSASVQVSIMSGNGRIVDTGRFSVAPDGQSALLPLSAGVSIPVQVTSTVAGVVRVIIPGTMAAFIGGTPIDVTFVAPTPQFDVSKSTLSVSSTWVSWPCVNGGYNDDFVAKVTAKDSQGNLMTDLDPSLMAFAASSTDVAFGKVVNNGDGTYSAPFTLAGEGPYTVSATYDGGPKIADSEGNTDPSVTRGTLHPVNVDWVGPATTIKADQTTVAVGKTSTISVTYAPSNPTCAPTSVAYEVAVTGGVGTFGGAGGNALAAAGSTTELTVPAGKTASVTLTSDTPGTVTVSVSAPNSFPMSMVSGSPVSITFTAPPLTPPSGSMALSASKVTQGQTVTASATLRQGNIVGTPVTFKMVNHNTGAVVGTKTCNTNASGTCSVSLPTGVAGVFDISASLQSGGTVVQLTSAALTLTVDPASQPSGPAAPAQTAITVQTGGTPQTSSPWGTAAVTMAALGLAVALLFRRQVRSSTKAR